jgi:F1F0 ATPase subunit 2
MSPDVAALAGALAGALAAGLALGGAYFGGLWWTVRRLPGSRSPAVLTLASFLARNALAAAGLWLATAGDWRRLAAALAGMLVVRTVLVRRLGPARTEGGAA